MSVVSPRLSNIWPVLGAVRFILALIVAIAHTRPLIALSEKPGPILHTILWLSGEGAVFCFFLISGFSISASYGREPKNFYFRRWLRIFPLYVPLVVLAGILPEFFGGKIQYLNGSYVTASYGDVMLNLCMLQGLLTDGLANLGVVWTLSVEWLLYLLTPLFAQLSNRMIIVLVGASALFHVGLNHFEILVPGQFGKPLFAMSWIWLLGFWLHRNHARHNASLFVLAFGSVILALVQSFWRGPLYELTWIATILAVTFGSSLSLPRPLRALMNELGDISYPYYLVHIIVYAVLTGLGFKGATWFAGVALIVAMILNRAYDQPVKRWISTKMTAYQASKKRIVLNQNSAHESLLAGD